VADALGSSMNVPTVRALGLIGEKRVLEKLHQLGFQNLQNNEYYGPSLALGSIDLSLWELTHGYRSLGREDSPFKKETRASLFNILASPEYRRFTFGMDSVLTLPFAAAVKTGTSKDMRDNWCVGWTDQYTVGVWIGNFNGEPMWNVSGMSGAAPIWRSLMLSLHKNVAPQELRYQEPAKALKLRALRRIKYPAANMLVGYDPDIPRAVQKMPIEVENARKDDKLYLNSKFLGLAQKKHLWPLRRGKFKVELKGVAGNVIDIVKFEVR
jgi:penicillin-binding protein 1C